MELRPSMATPKPVAVVNDSSGRRTVMSIKTSNTDVGKDIFDSGYQEHVSPPTKDEHPRSARFCRTKTQASCPNLILRVATMKTPSW